MHLVQGMAAMYPFGTGLRPADRLQNLFLTLLLTLNLLNLTLSLKLMTVVTHALNYRKWCHSSRDQSPAYRLQPCTECVQGCPAHSHFLNVNPAFCKIVPANNGQTTLHVTLVCARHTRIHIKISQITNRFECQMIVLR